MNVSVAPPSGRLPLLLCALAAAAWQEGMWAPGQQLAGHTEECWEQGPGQLRRKAGANVRGLRGLAFSCRTCTDTAHRKNQGQCPEDSSREARFHSRHVHRRIPPPITNCRARVLMSPGLCGNRTYTQHFFQKDKTDCTRAEQPGISCGLCVCMCAHTHTKTKGTERTWSLWWQSTPEIPAWGGRGSRITLSSRPAWFSRLDSKEQNKP